MLEVAMELIDKKQIGARLKALRKEHGLKQREVAEILHIAQSSYADYESGRNLITMESAIRLAKKYKCSIDYIIGNYKYWMKRFIWTMQAI